MRTQKEVDEFFKTHKIDSNSLGFVTGYLSALNIIMVNVTTTDNNGVDELCFRCWFEREMDNKESIIKPNEMKNARVKTLTLVDEFRDSEYFRQGNFALSYKNIQYDLKEIVNAAKVYILDNISKISNFSELVFRHYDKDNNTLYCTPRTPMPYDTFLKEGCDWAIFPVKTIDGVYSINEFEFSLLVNGTRVNHIDDVAIIEIASFIEKKLNQQ